MDPWLRKKTMPLKIRAPSSRSSSSAAPPTSSIVMSFPAISPTPSSNATSEFESILRQCLTEPAAIQPSLSSSSTSTSEFDSILIKCLTEPAAKFPAPVKNPPSPQSLVSSPLSTPLTEPKANHPAPVENSPSPPISPPPTEESRAPMPSTTVSPFTPTPPHNTSVIVQPSTTKTPYVKNLFPSTKPAFKIHPSDIFKKLQRKRRNILLGAAHCAYIIKKGERKGERCEKVCSEGIVCKQHTKTRTKVVESPPTTCKRKVTYSKKRINRLTRYKKYYIVRREERNSRRVLLRCEETTYVLRVPDDMDIPTGEGYYLFRDESGISKWRSD